MSQPLRRLFATLASRLPTLGAQTPPKANPVDKELAKRDHGGQS